MKNTYLCKLSREFLVSVWLEKKRIVAATTINVNVAFISKHRD